MQTNPPALAESTAQQELRPRWRNNNDSIAPQGCGIGACSPNVPVARRLRERNSSDGRRVQPPGVPTQREESRSSS